MVGFMDRRAAPILESLQDSFRAVLSTAFVPAAVGV
jgi:hypothetical protein